MTADDHTSDMEVTLRIIEDALGSSEANHVRTTFDGVGERIPDEEIRAIWREGAERARKAWRDFVFEQDMAAKDPPVWEAAGASGSFLRSAYETEVQELMSWLISQLLSPHG